MKSKFILRKDKGANEYGEFPVVIQYTTQGTSVKKSTGIFVKEEHWIGDNGRTNKYIKGGKDGDKTFEKKNNSLQRFKKKYDDIIDNLMTDSHCVMTVPLLRKILNDEYQKEVEEGQGKVGFVDYVLDYNHQLYDLGKISFSLWVNVKCYMGKFRKFLQKVKRKDLDTSTILYCRDVNEDLIKEYILWRKNDRGNSNDTINKSLTPIFKALKNISRKGWISREVCDEICDLYLPPESASLDKPKENDIEYLTKDQIRQFMKIVDESGYPRTKELADLFMFSVHTGFRISDVITLNWEEVDLKKRRIHHPMVKGHTQDLKWLDISITDGAMKILNRWEGKYDRFVFGQLPDLFDLGNEELLKKTINAKGRTLNQSLACIGDKMKLPFNLHSHLGRHTFAVHALNNHVDLKLISTILGHSSVLVTEKVYAKYLPETIKTTMDEKLNFNFED